MKMVNIGEVVGAFSISVGNRSGPLKRAASASILYQPAENQNILSYPLKRVRSQFFDTSPCGSANLSGINLIYDVIHVLTCFLLMLSSFRVD